MTPTLGRLRRVDLRTAWKNEASHFTPWLAQPENIALLGEALDLDLEAEAVETSVGDFRADILCRDTLRDTRVLIENQLGPTDHTHLGQLVTYAAGVDATTVVWICAQFREAHRSALDWLNEHTHEDLRFFGVQVELWRIDESVMAPKFEVVARPNAWSRQVKEAARSPSGLTPNEQAYVAFWQRFTANAEEKRLRYTTPALNTANWYGWGLGGKKTVLCARVSLTRNTASVLVSIGSGPERDACFNLLHADRDAIEREIGAPLRWVDQTREARISCDLAPDLSNPAGWPAMADEILGCLARFEQTFRPRIERIDASTWNGSAP